jgi:hypothetical protein
MTKNPWKTAVSNQPETVEQLDPRNNAPEATSNESITNLTTESQLQERRSSSESSHTPGQTAPPPPPPVTANDLLSMSQAHCSSTKGSTSRVSARSSRPQTLQRQSDSQGSDLSEPLDNSLSLSSPDYLRSPRQSADSDILGLRKYRIARLQIHSSFLTESFCSTVPQPQ